MIQSYKYFNKANEFLLGLSFKALVQITLTLIPIICLAFTLKLSLNSPLLLFLGIIAMIIIAFIIKSSRDLNVQGFYSSFVLHPFESHHYSWDSSQEAQQSIETLMDIQCINSKHIVTKNQDLVSIVKLESGLSFYRYSKEERELILSKWGAFLAKISGISNINSYFWSNSQSQDTIQYFCVIKNYDNPNYPDHDFIADESFYIILREKNPDSKDKPIIRSLKNLLKIKQSYSEEDLLQNLNEKTSTLISTLKSLEIDSHRLEDETLSLFLEEHLPLDPSYQVIDRAKFLEHHCNTKKFFTKTYRLSSSPESGDLGFWVRDYFKRIKHQAIISIELNSRNAYNDRRRAESRSSIFSQFNKSNSSYRNLIIQESKLIAETLTSKPYSFDLSFLITFITKSPEELQKIDNLIKQPMRSAEISGLERQQIKNWLSNLPLTANKLKQEDKIFCNLDFAAATFPFIKSPLGTSSGPLLGLSLENGMPVFLDEYDRSLCNNRGINFIGDSGSGKTVAAKFSIKKRLESDPDQCFYIIDNTTDGWNFFINYYGGIIVELDNPYIEAGTALFAPLRIDHDTYHNSHLYNNHLERVLGLLELIANRPLSNQDKSYLSQILRSSYQDKLDLRLSDLYQVINQDSDDKSNYWLETLSPYTRICSGIYATLMDGEESCKLQGKLILFTFSKIQTDPIYQNLCLKLLTSFIEERIITRQQTKTTLILDEAWKIFQNQHSTQGKELLTHLARAGRGLDLGLWTISQKPSDLPSEIHSSASISLCFQLKERNDRLDMARYANLNDCEKQLLDSYEIKESGVCLLKTTRSSDLIKVELNKKENLLCNSTRDFSNLRQTLANNHIKLGLEQRSACKEAIKELMTHE
jgi:hypothetical protein